jgi:putative hydrolase of the HAD superfamily
MSPIILPWSRDAYLRPPKMTFELHRGQLNLIFDADDTLWDSNLHFLEAQADFFECLRVCGVEDRTQIAAAIRTHELAIIEQLGYGRAPFLAALRRVIDEIVHPERHPDLLRDLARIGATLMDRDCPLLPGVASTIAELAERHRLILFTKGQPEEQMGKLERSGLRPFFSRVGIPIEKDIGAYRRLVAQAQLDPARTIMIGNSPRSDINPAIRAGLGGAVFIPHPHTWELEHEELMTDDRVVTVDSFPHLRDLF